MKPDQNPEQNPEQTSFPGSSIHPVEELQRKGIRKLRVIPESQLKKTAREAVAHALLELLDGLEIDEPVLVPLRGDFFCMPFGANLDPYQGEKHVVLGNAADTNGRQARTDCSTCS